MTDNHKAMDETGGWTQTFAWECRSLNRKKRWKNIKKPKNYGDFNNFVLKNKAAPKILCGIHKEITQGSLQIFFLVFLLRMSLEKVKKIHKLLEFFLTKRYLRR